MAWVLAAVVAVSAARLDDGFTAREQAVLAELDRQRFIKARELAHALLKDSPGSFVGAWAMARVHHDEEGNHARALAWVRRAAQRLARADPAWDRRVLLEEYAILLEMNRPDDALAVLDVHAERYGQPWLGLRMWPMLKLKRFEEAKALGRRLAASAELEDRIEGYNGLLSVAFEEHDRFGSYRWAMDALKMATDQECTLVRNAAASAVTALKLEEGIELALKARTVRGCIEPVENTLAMYYLYSGQFQQAVSALEQSRVGRIEKRYRPQFALVRRAVLVELLSALGKPAEALALAEELATQQQRVGASSSPPEVEKLSREVRLAFALDVTLASLAEDLAGGSVAEGVEAVAELARLSSRRWEVRRTIFQRVAQGEELSLLVRPHVWEASDWASWRAAELTDIVGAGVMRGALRRAREADAEAPAALAALDAVEAEVAWRSSDGERAIALATKALEGLPRAEALMRWRTQAVLAAARWAAGQRAEATPLFHELLQSWPAVLRIAGVRVPVRLVSQGGGEAAVARRRLARSPRFEEDERAPFTVSATASGEDVELCLLDSSGARFACASGKGAGPAIKAFHAAAFSPKVSLTQADLKSLDGSPVRVGADQALEKLLKP